MLQHNQFENTYSSLINPFGVRVEFFNDKDDFDRYVETHAKKQIKIPNQCDGYALTFKDHNNFKSFAIFVDKNQHNPKKKLYDYGLIAHECIHIAHMVFGFVGQESTSDNDELLCYTVQSLVNDFDTYSKL